MVSKHAWAASLPHLELATNGLISSTGSLLEEEIEDSEMVDEEVTSLLIDSLVKEELSLLIGELSLLEDVPLHAPSNKAGIINK